MQDFKKYNNTTIRIIVFFAILAAILAAISVKTEIALLENDRLVPVRNKNIYRIQREADNSIDVLILGDSLSYSSFSPMRLWKQHGITSFVCGQPAQKMRESEEMLRIALKNQKPKLVIIETDAMYYEQFILKNLSDYTDSLLNNLIPVFRGHDTWKSLVMQKEYVEENYKGFAFRCKVKPYEKGEYMLKTEHRKRIPNASLNHMGQIINLCKENGAEILLVNTASPVNSSYEKHNAVADYAQENSLPFLDLNFCLEEMKIDWKTDTLDSGDHLNLSGAEKATIYLGNYLTKNYSLPDHREDKAFAKWEEESAVYEEKAAKHLIKIRGEKG